MVDTYDYMCLHHNYKTFTAGERQWNMSGLLSSTHLATKEEILAHFSSVVQAVVEETGIQLLTLWGCEVVKRERQGDKMEITVQPVEDVARVLDIPEVTVVADRMIIATGTNLAIQRPLSISTTYVHSLLPSDLTKLPWSTMLTHLQKPVVVAGSGKTAMDTIVFFGSTTPSRAPASEVRHRTGDLVLQPEQVYSLRRARSTEAGRAMDARLHVGGPGIARRR